MSLIEESEWYSVYELGMDVNLLVDKFNLYASINEAENAGIILDEKNKYWICDNDTTIHDYVNNITPVGSLATTTKVHTVESSLEIVPDLTSAFLYYDVENKNLPPHVTPKSKNDVDIASIVYIPLSGEWTIKSCGRAPFINPHFADESLRNNDNDIVVYDYEDFVTVDTVECKPGYVYVIKSSEFVTSFESHSDRKQVLQFCGVDNDTD